MVRITFALPGSVDSRSRDHLTDIGQSQVRALAQKLGNTRFDSICRGEARQDLETARIVVGQTDADWLPLPELDLPLNKTVQAAIRNLGHAAIADYRAHDHSIFKAIMAYGSEAWVAIKQKLRSENKPIQKVLVVGPNGLLQFVGWAAIVTEGANAPATEVREFFAAEFGPGEGFCLTIDEKVCDIELLQDQPWVA